MGVKYGVGDMEHLHHQLCTYAYNNTCTVHCEYLLYATTVRVQLHTVIVKKVYLITNCIYYSRYIAIETLNTRIFNGHNSVGGCLIGWKDPMPTNIPIPYPHNLIHGSHIEEG